MPMPSMLILGNALRRHGWYNRTCHFKKRIFQKRWRWRLICVVLFASQQHQFLHSSLLILIDATAVVLFDRRVLWWPRGFFAGIKWSATWAAFPLLKWWNREKNPSHLSKMVYWLSMYKVNLFPKCIRVAALGGHIIHIYVAKLPGNGLKSAAPFAPWWGVWQASLV